MVIKGDGFLLRSCQLSDKMALLKHANNKNISDNLRDRFPQSVHRTGCRMVRELFIGQ